MAENKVDRQLRSRVRNLDLGPVLEVIAGDSAIDDFGIAPADLPTCGGGTDEECWARSFMGNRRHGCVDRAEGRLCDRFRLEPRRIQIKPDGLEIVLAENPGDPQAGLLAGIDGPLPGDEPLCDPWRGQDLDETDVPFETAVERATTPAALNGRLCGHDEVGCTAICPQFNTRCNDAVLLGAVRPEDAPPTGSRCFHGQCCPPSEACGGYCVDLESDDANCGSCGNACELGAHCEGGVCVVP